MKRTALYYKIGGHLLFWVLAIGLLTLFYGHFTEQYTTSFWFVCLLMPVIMGSVYFINYFLVPKYLLQQRYKKFIVYLLYSLVASIYLQLSLVVYSYINLADYQYERMNPISSDLVFLVFGSYFIVFFATSLLMLQHWFTHSLAIDALERQKVETQLKLKETELKALRNQIHPHFLFNTLNNLYGLAREKSELLPNALLQLSNLLDALLYKGDKDFIYLTDELALLEDYVALEKLRFEERLHVKMTIEGNLSEIKVPTFVLFTLVENAFTHGFSESWETLFLEYSVRLNQNELTILVMNTIPKQIAKKQSGGIGLQNLKSRLHMHYSTCTFTTQVDSSHFCVTIKIALNTKQLY